MSSFVVAQNLVGVRTGLPGNDSNVTWRWSADPSARDSNDPAEHERIGQAHAQIAFLDLLGNQKFA
uniref:hypothetical protein n=1 Tax=Paractinoplanes polyasparticus TaxID=2856853 RepID=UPI001C846271|nr:hypothetical protein [Actinoplanes polyasparticus]